jgi:hypothetical protein
MFEDLKSEKNTECISSLLNIPVNIISKSFINTCNTLDLFSNINIEEGLDVTGAKVFKIGQARIFALDSNLSLVLGVCILCAGVFALDLNSGLSGGIIVGAGVIGKSCFNSMF